MQYEKSIGGDWVNGDNISNGAKIKIVSECTKQESKFKDKDGNYKTENIVKVRVKGEDDSKNMRLNWSTVYALIDAFGKESKDWVNNILTVQTLDAMVGDTMRTIIYLIPDGFELIKTEEKKMIIQKIGGEEEDTSQEHANEETVSPDDIPF